MERFEKLSVWQKARELTVYLYKLTSKYPAEERFGLVPQIRRAAISVVANIAEGCRRQGQRDRVHFHTIADASLEELKCHAILSADLGFISSEDKNKTLERANEVARMLMGLNKTILAVKNNELSAVGRKL